MPANLVMYQWSGWNGPLVPREAADATFASVPAPATLPGNADATYWNLGWANLGESATGSGFQVHTYADGAWNAYVTDGGLGPYYGNYGLNLIPLNFRGGRHTFGARVDAYDQVAETNESDNVWARQWVWSPLGLTPGVPVTRGAPPARTGGWDFVTDGSPLYANSDGLRMTGASWWSAAVMRPLSSTADHDLSLHAASSGAGDGFATSLAYSGAGPGYLEALVVNHNTVGWGAVHDVGVNNWNGDGSAYELVHATNAYLAYGDSVTVTYAQDEMLRVFEFYVDAANLGPVSITVDVAPLSWPMQAQWLHRDFQTGSLYSYWAWAQTGEDGRARLDLTINDAGYHALVVYRHPDWSAGNPARDVTIEIDRTPPDFLPPLLAGWYAPIVPRAAFDGTAGSVPAPSTLPGNTASTFLNMAVRNNSVSDSPAGLPAQVHIDGAYSAWVAWGGFPATTFATFNWDIPFTFAGGRHTLGWKLDADNAIEEMDETNNNWTEQWVWSPLELPNFTPVGRVLPADAYGGWTELSTGEPFHPNCDGLRLPVGSGYWRAVAAMPSAGADVDLRLHQPSGGAKDGFAANLAGSWWGGDASDYVLVNLNLAADQPYDAGAVRYSGTGSYVVESTVTGGWLTLPDGIYGPYSLPANRILNLMEVYLPAGQTGIHLMNVSGDVDWGLSLHGATAAYQGKSDVLGTAYATGAGGNELLVVDVPAAGYYCIAVWKTTSSQLAKGGTYNLLIRPMWASGVEDGVPAVATRLVDIAPNPFNPQTRITYELAGTGRVQLEIYDLQGRRVRTLVDAEQGAGRHEEAWNGLDDAGGRAASGLYMARLTAGGVTQMMKMTLVK